MKRGITWLSGAGLMYLLDPQAGRRRRALLRDQIESAVRRVDDRLDVTVRDVRHRVEGLVAGARTLLKGEKVADDVLVERVRSKMGHFVSHPRAIEVSACDGRVVLSGPILEREADDLLRSISSLRGVTTVENRLEIHPVADVAALQGGRGRPGNDLFRGNWSPATRLFAGAVGCGLMANCALRRTPLATLLGTVGFGLFVRGLTNLKLKRLTGIGGGRRAVDVHKTITIAAPVEQVFEFWASYENFPRFMSHLYEVRDLGAGRSHWVAAGPAGVPVTWDAVLTRVVAYELLAWRSEPGSAIANAGIIRFEPKNDRSTRLEIQLCYNPPAEVLGHFAALLFGDDPKSAMDEDLARLKSLLEQGKASAPGKKVLREDLAPESYRRGGDRLPPNQGKR